VPGRPNVVFVVMDSVSAKSFDSCLAQSVNRERLSSFFASSVRFERALSTTNWTLPSHASLLSGTYPWRDGYSFERSFKPRPHSNSLPSALRELGYCSSMFSSNQILGPVSGLTDAFDFFAWGTWGETSLRRGFSPEPPYQSPAKQGAEVRTTSMKLLDWQRLNPLFGDASNFLPRHPMLLEVASRAFQRVRNPDSAVDFRVSPWIEPSLRRWLATIPEERPVFCLVNLMEGHEPFLSEKELSTGLRSRRRHVRQDRAGWLSGKWAPTQRDYDDLRSLYLENLSRLGDRISSIVAEFERASRWDNTLLVLTSDHGQAFGEHGMLFHGNWVHDPEVRVPLFIRVPKTIERPQLCENDWLSLSEIAPWILAVCEASEKNRTRASAVSPTSVPRYVLSEGTPFSRAKAGDPHASNRHLRSPWVAGYRGHSKACVELWSHRSELYDLAADPLELSPRTQCTTSDELELIKMVKGQAGLIESRGVSDGNPSISDRLRGWGYL